MHVLRQSPADLLKILDDARARPVQIRPVLENDEDVGIAEHGLCPNGFDVRRGQQAGDDRIGDLIFDDIGRFTIPSGVDDHLHIRDIRQGVERYVVERPDSRKGQQQDARENQEPVAGARFYESREHVYMPPVALIRNCLAPNICPFF